MPKRGGYKITDWDLWSEGADGADYCQSIYELAKMFNCKKGLEIGVRFGKSALAFLRANNNSTLVGIDPNPEFDVVNFMKEQGVADRFTFINDYSPQAIPNDTYDWVYIDGNHTYQPIMADFMATWGLLKKGGVMLFDDYNPNLGYGTDTKAVLDVVLPKLGRNYFTTKDLGLYENPHGSAIIIK